MRECWWRSGVRQEILLRQTEGTDVTFFVTLVTGRVPIFGETGKKA